MLSAAFAAVLVGALNATPPAAPAAPQVFEGRIKDVRGTEGTLTLTLGEGRRAKDRTFQITEARIEDPTGVELKVGSLRTGDRVQVEMTADSRMVRVIRVLPKTPPGKAGDRARRPRPS
jgi:hypothetical protein